MFAEARCGTTKADATAGCGVICNTGAACICPAGQQCFEDLPNSCVPSVVAANSGVLTPLARASVTGGDSTNPLCMAPIAGALRADALESAADFCRGTAF